MTDSAVRPTYRRPAPDVGPGSRRSRHSVGALVIAAYLVAAAAVLAVQDAFSLPRWLALHLVVLGAASNAVLVYSRHFTQALLHPGPASEWPAVLRLGVFNLGVVAVLTGRSRGLTALAALGATLVVVAVATHVGSLLAMARTSTVSGPLRGVVWFYVAGGVALIAGGTLGGVLVSGVLDSAAWETAVRLAHVHLNLFGWLGLVVVGTQFMLWPAVLRTRMAESAPRAARHVLGLAVSGLAVATGGLLLAPLSDLGWWAAAVGMAVYAAGVGYSLVPAVVEMRAKRPRSTSAVMLVAGTTWLLVALVADISDLLQDAGGNGSSGDLPGILVPSLAVGFVAQVVTGAMTFLLPVTIGGGPRGNKRLTAILEYGWLARVPAGNLGLLLVVSPTDGDLRLLGWTLVVLGFGSFAVLVLLAVIAAHRPVAAVPGPRTAQRSTSGPELLAVCSVAAVLALLTLIGTGTWPRGEQDAVAATTAVSEVPVAVELDEFAITPSTVSVSPGTRLVLAVRNEGQQNHDLRLEDGRGTRMLAPGESATLDLGVVDHDAKGWCTVAGHRQAGMTFAIRLESAGSADPGAAGQAQTGGHDHVAGAVTGAVPGPDWRPYDPGLRPAPGATEHDVTWRIAERTVEIAPGVRQQVWTFDGSVPGPTLRGRIGDLFTVHLVNGATIAHSIDFHASQVDPGTAMRSIEPGATLTYQFRAAHAGVWLYHCGTAPLIQHVAMGMYGAVVIDPADLPPADREYVLVQSEFYRGDDGGVPDMSSLMAAHPDYVTFNGYADQYRYAPIRVKVGQRVRLWVLDAGPNLPTSFHVVGAQFDTVFKEGAYLLRPDSAVGGAAQALDLQPGQGGFVELEFSAPGRYPILTHRLADAGRGALGLVQVEN